MENDMEKKISFGKETILEKVEIQLEDIYGELEKAKLITTELITDINDSHMPYDVKEKLDTKERIVQDYVKLSFDKIREILKNIGMTE